MECHLLANVRNEHYEDGRQKCTGERKRKIKSTFRTNLGKYSE